MPSQQSPAQRFFLWLWYPARSSLVGSLLAMLLYPLAALLQLIARQRRRRLEARQESLSVPVVVVGNISVGGSGKTPVVIALAKKLLELGYKPGIISRGYGGKAPSYPYEVNAQSPVIETGDEALMMAQSLACPVVIDSDRLAAAKHLLKQHPETDLLISDDGLQHYRLPRSYEIVVVDGERGLGNAHCLPAGPLREPADRLKQADFVLVNGNLKQVLPGFSDGLPSYKLAPRAWRSLCGSRAVAVDEESFPALKHQGSIKAIAAIGNPGRFFKTVAALGIQAKTTAFDDHHPFSADDFAHWENHTVLMTQKDAVKCRAFASQDWWWLEVEALLPPELVKAVVALVPDQ